MSRQDNQLTALDHRTITYLKTISSETDPNFFPELIELYLSQIPSLMDELKQTVLLGNGKVLERIAHRIKGSSLNLGALGVADICGKLESKGKNGDQEDIEPLMAQLQIQFEGVCRELEELKNDLQV